MDSHIEAKRPASSINSIRWKRALRSSVFLGCLTLLGVGIHRFEPDEPRWTVRGSRAEIDAPLRFSADGKTAYTSPFAGSTARGWSTMAWSWHINEITDRAIFTDLANAAPSKNKLRGWNLQTGELSAAHPATGQLTGTSIFSKDGRYLAAMCEWPNLNADELRRFICLIDLHTNEERQLPLRCALDEATLHFSPCGQYLIVGLAQQNGPVQVYACATGELLADWYCAGLLAGAVFADGHLLCLERDDAEQRHIVLRNLRDRRAAAKLTRLKDNAEFAMRGEYLVVPGAQAGEWATWNLRTRKIEAEWKTELANAWLTEVVGVGDRIIACVGPNGTETLESWDIQTGKQLGNSKHSAWQLGSARASDGRFCATYSPAGLGRLSIWPSPKPGFRMIEMPSLKQLWELDTTHKYAVAFTKDGNRVIVAPNTGDTVDIRECATGKVQHAITVGPIGNSRDVPILAVSGNHLLIQQSVARANGLAPLFQDMPFWRRALQWLRIDPDARPRDLAIVYDLEANRECVRLRGWDIASALLSDDGATLLTTHDEDGVCIMRCWDVGATKPLRWPLAIPATLGVLLWASAKGVGRWRRQGAEKRFRSAAPLQQQTPS